MAPEQKEDPAERELFATIKGTYALAEEPEQHAMIKELRRMTTITSGERRSLIDAIENSIGQNVEWQELEL